MASMSQISFTMFELREKATTMEDISRDRKIKSSYWVAFEGHIYIYTYMYIYILNKFKRVFFYDERNKMNENVCCINWGKFPSKYSVNTKKKWIRI